MKLIDDIMDAMGIVDEVEEEEIPHKSREERMAKVEAAKAAKIAKEAQVAHEEAKEEKKSTTEKIKSFFGKKDESAEAVEEPKEEKTAAPAKRRLNFDFTKKAEVKEESRQSIPAPAVKKPIMTKASEPVRRPSVPSYNTGAVNMQMIEPTSFDDSQRVADCLHSNQPVIVNFENTDPIVAKRMTDFISGTIYALQGNMKKIGRNILICAPKNVDIDNGLGFERRDEE